MHETRNFLIIAAQHLFRPMKSVLSFEASAETSVQSKRSSSTFTTFRDLAYGAKYYSGELPVESDLFEKYVRDCAWASPGPVGYDEIAHVLIPRFFSQEIVIVDGDHPIYWNTWTHEQDIGGLSKLLDQARRRGQI
jgi:hypothetical protein